MSCDVASVVTRGQTFWRVGRGADPWQFVDWTYADHDGRFDGRWDDPDGTYRVLSACDSKFGAYVEVLADFRPDPEVAAGLAGIVTNSDDEDAGPEPGQVPRSWMEDRVVGRASVTGEFAEVGHSRSLAVLRDELAGLLVRHRLDDLDASAIRVSAPRAFTQQLSRFIYECTDERGGPQFDGIQYLSRLGDDLANLAVFELPLGGAEVSEVDLTPLEEHDEDLQRAMHHHGLVWLDDLS